jgi:ABC-type antimicrobial peptide transport system permease subunit
LLALLSLCSFSLGTFGVFCLTSENMRRGARDAAVRVALGATSQILIRDVVTATVRRVAIGSVVGLALGTAVARLAAALAAGLRTFDVTAAATVAALMVGAASVASFIPARSAGRADVLALLREE